MIRVIDNEHLQVGERTWFGEFSTHGSATPEMAATMSERLGYDFDFQRRQFIVRFESKWIVSIIWGSMTYSDNHDHGFGRGPYAELVETPETVEVAILHADREGIQGGDHQNYCDADDVNFTLDLMSRAATDDSVLVEGHLVLTIGTHTDDSQPR